jgi:hypothetical protein
MSTEFGLVQSSSLGGTGLHTWRRPGPFSKHRHQAQIFVSGVCYMLITGQGKLDILYPPLESYNGPELMCSTLSHLIAIYLGYGLTASQMPNPLSNDLYIFHHSKRNPKRCCWTCHADENDNPPASGSSCTESISCRFEVATLLLVNAGPATPIVSRVLWSRWISSESTQCADSQQTLLLVLLSQFFL